MAEMRHSSLSAMGDTIKLDSKQCWGECVSEVLTGCWVRVGTGGHFQGWLATSSKGKDILPYDSSASSSQLEQMLTGRCAGFTESLLYDCYELEIATPCRSVDRLPLFRGEMWSVKSRGWISTWQPMRCKCVYETHNASAYMRQGQAKATHNWEQCSLSGRAESLSWVMGVH